MRAAVLRYRVMAYVTGVVLMVLVFVGIPLQVAHHPQLANVVGVIHGILYIIYLGCAWLLARMLRIPVKQTLILLLAGTVPIMTFIVERWATRRFIDPALASPASEPEGAALSGLRSTASEPEGAALSGLRSEATREDSASKRP